MEARVTTINGNVIVGKVRSIDDVIIALDNARVEHINEIGDFMLKVISDEDFVTIVKRNIKTIDVL